MLNLVGEVFGQLTVVSFAERRRKKAHWNCVCIRGTTKQVSTSNLRAGNVISCGCWKKAFLRELAQKAVRHGNRRRDCKRSRTYNSWANMKERCINPNHQWYKNYGGSGVTICEEWKTFENFARDMGERPEGYTLDRINPFGNYCKENCRWATAKQQANNRRSNYKVIPFRRPRTTTLLPRPLVIMAPTVAERSS